MATRSMIDWMIEQRREESLDESGWRREFITALCKNDKIHACEQCGRLPRLYKSEEGRYAFCCTACGCGGDEADTGKAALREWNKEHKKGDVWSITNNTINDPASKKTAWEQVSADGGIELVFKDK